MSKTTSDNPKIQSKKTVIVLKDRNKRCDLPIEVENRIIYAVRGYLNAQKSIPPSMHKEVLRKYVNESRDKRSSDHIDMFEYICKHVRELWNNDRVHIGAIDRMLRSCLGQAPGERRAAGRAAIFNKWHESYAKRMITPLPDTTSDYVGVITTRLTPVPIDPKAMYDDLTQKLGFSHEEAMQRVGIKVID